MRWLVMLAVMLAAPGAMAFNPSQCRALDVALGEIIRTERAQIAQEATIRETLLHVMGIVPEATQPGQTRTRDMLEATRDALAERVMASEQLAKRLEDLQHRARLCARQ